jgi:hypothetical protein
LEILKKIIGVVPIVIGIFLGIKVMLWGSVVASFISYFLNSYYSARIRGGKRDRSKFIKEFKIKKKWITNH